MASRLSIIPSPLPPFSGLSNSASARYPCGAAEGACAVKLPKSSLPLSMRPLPDAFRPLGALGALQERGTGLFPVQITCGLPVTTPKMLTPTVQSHREVAHSLAPP